MIFIKCLQNLSKNAKDFVLQDKTFHFLRNIWNSHSINMQYGIVYIFNKFSD